MTTPNTLDHFSAVDRAIGRRITRSFASWLELCTRHDAWHELPDDKQTPTLENVAAFLDDYTGFEPVDVDTLIRAGRYLTESVEDYPTETRREAAAAADAVVQRRREEAAQ